MIDSNNKLKSLSRALLESAQSILTEKKAVKKDLAKLAPPYDKVTHGDVLVGRKVFTHDEVKAHKAKKGIKEDADMVVIHAPVLGDIDGELAEVLKRDPRDKTVHIQYEGMKYVLKAGQYEELDEAVKNPYAVGMAAAMKSTGDTPPLKKSTITKAHEIAKKIDEEVEELDESAKIVAHLVKRYGDNVSKSHVKSAASDFGVDASKLAKAVRAKLGKTSLAEEEQIDEISSKTLFSYGKKARKEADKLDDPMHRARGRLLASKKTNPARGGYKLTKVAATFGEEADQIDELSKDTMLKYLSANKKSDAKAQEAGDHSKSVKRMRGTDVAVRKYTAKPGSKSVRVPATEEVEHIDELSHDTLRSYRMKAKSNADQGGEQRTKGRDLASRKSYGGRMAGIPKAKVMASEEVEAIDELSSDTVKSYADKAMGDAVQKTQAQQKKKYASDIKADQKGIDKRVRGLTMAKKKMANEDVELSQEEIDFIESTLSDLEEGRGRPPKEGSAAHKAKMQQDLADMPALGVQIRKAASINKPVTFMDGKSKQISDNHINRFHDHMDSRKTSQDKSAFQKRAHKSHDEFVKAVSEPVPGRSKDTGEIVKYR
jgi:hypothetical protein